jgi:hypothetical protein
MRFSDYWNRFVTLGGILLCMVICAAAIASVRLLPPTEQSLSVGPQITILAANTHTATVPPTIISNATPTSTANVHDGIQAGLYVQITGTNGSGLRIRSSPGLTEPVNFFGVDSEVFLVLEGPTQQDGYLWWFIAAPYDTNRSGWAVADFLSLVTQ